MRARLPTLDLESAWFAAPRRMEAEQAAAKSLHRLLVEFDKGVESEQTVHPRSALNELIQQGRLVECDVRITDQEGPDNEPRFTAKGQARLVDDNAVRTDGLSGPSARLCTWRRPSCCGWCSRRWSSLAPAWGGTAHGLNRPGFPEAPLVERM